MDFKSVISFLSRYIELGWTRVAGISSLCSLVLMASSSSFRRLLVLLLAWEVAVLGIVIFCVHTFRKTQNKVIFMYIIPQEGHRLGH